MKYELEEHELQELIHWSRRYCDLRSTYAPSMFNELLDSIMKRYPTFVPTLDDQHYFPWAQDGMYNPDNGNFDARPAHARNMLAGEYMRKHSKPLQDI